MAANQESRSLALKRSRVQNASNVERPGSSIEISGSWTSVKEAGLGRGSLKPFVFLFRRGSYSSVQLLHGLRKCERGRIVLPRQSSLLFTAHSSPPPAWIQGDGQPDPADSRIPFAQGDRPPKTMWITGLSFWVQYKIGARADYLTKSRS